MSKSTHTKKRGRWEETLRPAFFPCGRVQTAWRGQAGARRGSQRCCRLSSAEGRAQETPCLVRPPPHSLLVLWMSTRAPGRDQAPDRALLALRPSLPSPHTSLLRTRPTEPARPCRPRGAGGARPALPPHGARILTLRSRSARVYPADQSHRVPKATAASCTNFLGTRERALCVRTPKRPARPLCAAHRASPPRDPPQPA